MKTILPMSNPVISGRYNYAVPLSILGVEQNYLPWLYNNFINLYFQHYNDLRSFNFYEFPLKDEQYFLPFLHHVTMDRIGVTVPFIDFVIDQINKETYLYVTVNKYNIPNTSWYHKFYFHHPICIYGYDTDSETCFIKTYDSDYIFRDSTVHFQELDAAYYHIDESKTFNKTIRLFQYRRNMTESINIPRIKTLLNDFIHPPHDPYVSGQDIYPPILAHIQMVMEDRGDIFVLRKNLHILFEQNKIMLMRLRYLREQQLLADDSFIRRQEALTEETEMFRNSVMRFYLTRDSKIFEKLMTTVRSFSERQVQFYQDLRDAL